MAFVYFEPICTLVTSMLKENISRNITDNVLALKPFIKNKNNCFDIGNYNDEVIRLCGLYLLDAIAMMKTYQVFSGSTYIIFYKRGRSILGHYVNLYCFATVMVVSFRYATWLIHMPK